MASDFGDESARRGLTGLESMVHLATQIIGEASTFLLRSQVLCFGHLTLSPCGEGSWASLCALLSSPQFEGIMELLCQGQWRIQVLTLGRVGWADKAWGVAGSVSGDEKGTWHGCAFVLLPSKALSSSSRRTRPYITVESCGNTWHLWRMCLKRAVVLFLPGF